MARRTSARLSSLISTNGRRTSARALPSRLAAYFTGAGLVSQNIAACSGARRSLIAIALATSPARHACCICAHSRGATLAVTEMQPWPPAARNGSAVPSSPESWQNCAPMASRVRIGRPKSWVASLTPTMFGSLASRAMVATVMSTTQRAGML